MRVGIERVQFQGSAGFSPNERRDLRHGPARVSPGKEGDKPEQRVRRGILRIERDRLLAVFLGAGVCLGHVPSSRDAVP